MISQLTPSDFAAWRDCAAAGLAPTVLPVVLDVREPWEVQTASVREDGFSLLALPMREVPARLAELKDTLGTDHPIACLCHHGIRSQQVADYLVRNGFTNVVNLQGGIAAWAQMLDTSVAQY